MKRAPDPIPRPPFPCWPCRRSLRGQDRPPGSLRLGLGLRSNANCRRREGSDTCCPSRVARARLPSSIMRPSGSPEFATPDQTLARPACTCSLATRGVAVLWLARGFPYHTCTIMPTAGERGALGQHREDGVMG